MDEKYLPERMRKARQGHGPLAELAPGPPERDEWPPDVASAFSAAHGKGVKRAEHTWSGGLVQFAAIGIRIEVRVLRMLEGGSGFASRLRRLSGRHLELADLVGRKLHAGSRLGRRSVVSVDTGTLRQHLIAAPARQVDAGRRRRHFVMLLEEA